MRHITLRTNVIALLICWHVT